ncbi:MAG: hypothetical protein WC718_15885 [Phycisphaerales bacterium]|jgi:hypothetical protein
MGVWGYRLFEDDAALDIRSEFRDHIGDGHTPTQAVAKLMKAWRPERWDTQAYASFWLALAATSWDLGRLTPLVKRRALGVLDNEIGLAEWKATTPRALAARRQVYQAIRRKLEARQPAPKHVPQRKRLTTPFRAGDLIRYETLHGKMLYLRVLCIAADLGGKYAVCDICKWKAKTPPPRELAGKLPRQRPLQRSSTALRRGEGVMWLYGNPPKYPPASRTTLIARKLDLTVALDSGPGGSLFGGWAKLDEYLRAEFGIE